MKVSGILETALSVADPAASAAFYKRLFGFDTLLDNDRLVALNVAGRDVLLDEAASPREGGAGCADHAGFEGRTLRRSGVW